MICVFYYPPSAIHHVSLQQSITDVYNSESLNWNCIFLALVLPVTLTPYKLSWMDAINVTALHVCLCHSQSSVYHNWDSDYVTNLQVYVIAIIFFFILEIMFWHSGWVPLLQYQYELQSPLSCSNGLTEVPCSCCWFIHMTMNLKWTELQIQFSQIQWETWLTTHIFLIKEADYFQWSSNCNCLSHNTVYIHLVAHCWRSYLKVLSAAKLSLSFDFDRHIQGGGFDYM